MNKRLYIVVEGQSVWMAIIGFMLFLLIGIFKSLGCGWIDQNVEGGWSVM